MRPRAGSFAAVAMSVCTGALAHDFWIEPSSFRPPVPSDLAVGLRVGQDFHGDPVPRNPKLIERFALVSQSGETAIGGFPGADPAGIVRIESPGTYWIAYRSGRTPLAMEPDKFEKYLLEEGLERFVEARRQRGESGKPSREVFSRSVKSLVLAGAGPARGYDRPLGMTLELVPEKDPGAIAAGGKLPVRLLSEGKPLAGALVVGMNQAVPAEKVKARTDRNGRATLAIDRKGIWLVKAVHMQPAPAGLDADWESIWASLTFEIPQAPK